MESHLILGVSKQCIIYANTVLGVCPRNLYQLYDQGPVSTHVYGRPGVRGGLRLLHTQTREHFPPI